MSCSRPQVSHLLLALSAVPIIAGCVRLAQLATGALDSSSARFLQAPWPVTLHILAATVFSVLGAFQIDPRRRGHALGWHRSAGAVALVSGLVVAVTGAHMTVAYSIPTTLQGPLLRVTRLTVSAAMLVSLLLALRAINKRRFQFHGRWMLRAYALGSGAGTQVIVFLPAGLFLAGQPQGLPRDVLMAAAWGLNLAVAEIVIRRASMQRLARSTSDTGQLDQRSQAHFLRRGAS